MCRILAILTAAVVGLALTGSLQASHPPGGGGGGKGGASKGSAGKGSAGKGGSSAGKSSSSAGKGGNAGKNNGTGTKSPGTKTGKNGSGKASNGSRPRGFPHRMGNWGPRHWNSAYGCWCYYSPDDDTDYYWYAPDQCYYPVGYSPSGRYNYDNQ